MYVAGLFIVITRLSKCNQVNSHYLDRKILAVIKLEVHHLTQTAKLQHHIMNKQEIFCS
jgi:hypothetical protein